MGHSMGCLVLNSYISLNPEIAARLAGVIFSTPLFSLPPLAKMDPLKSAIIKLYSIALKELDDFILMP